MDTYLHVCLFRTIKISLTKCRKLHVENNISFIQNFFDRKQHKNVQRSFKEAFQKNITNLSICDYSAHNENNRFQLEVHRVQLKKSIFLDYFHVVCSNEAFNNFHFDLVKCFQLLVSAK